MWKLINTKKEHWDHFIFVGEECIVGRKDAALLISNDPSISRKHAVLSVKHPEENLGNPSKRASLFLRDEGSKYGSFKNGVKITNEEELADGDVVKFGQLESEFRIQYEPLIVTTSCLDVASKNKLKEVIHKLGGHLVSEWQPSCTHLVMSLVKVTIKALCCLVSLKPIVLPDYFEELEKKLKSSATIIPPNGFIPPIGESLIDKDVVSFDINPQRKNIFKNKTFFFMDNKQFKKLHLGIIMGGGTASVFSENRDDLNLLVEENSCFIEPVEESKNFLKDIRDALQKKNMRMIPESDVGLAVAYASTEKFCNPSFNIGSVLMGSHGLESQTLSEREVYVPGTQEHIGRPKRSANSFLLDSERKSKKQKLEAPDSLNLTTSRAENIEDIFEVPLSAEVKQELEDLFDVTMKDVTDNAQEEEEVPATLPAVPERVNRIKPTVSEDVPKKQISLKKPKSEKNTSYSKENEFTSFNQISPKKPKIENNTSYVKENGFTSFNMNGDEESNLPRNLMQIKFAALTIQKPVIAAKQNSLIKNFKKFKKVLSTRAQALPRIIGGHDLVPYDRDAAKIANNWDDEVEVVRQQPVKGAFDWDSQNT